MNPDIKYSKLRIFTSAFTLIELLVVIAIIGVLATLLIANVNASRQRARDAQRKADLRNIQTALGLYFNDFGEFPASSGGQIYGCDSGGTALCAWGSDFIAEQTYMSVLPEDPSVDRSYIYARDPILTDTYTLQTCLENASDDKCQGACAGGLEGCVYLVKP